MVEVCISMHRTNEKYKLFQSKDLKGRDCLE
jgi:hypothetical protein